MRDFIKVINRARNFTGVQFSFKWETCTFLFNPILYALHDFTLLEPIRFYDVPMVTKELILISNWNPIKGFSLGYFQPKDGNYSYYCYK